MNRKTLINTCDLLSIRTLLTDLDHLSHRHEISTITKAIENSKSLLIEIWHTVDVFGIAGQENLFITEEEAIEVLHLMDSTHDANLGHSWESMSSALDQVVKKNDESPAIKYNVLSPDGFSIERERIYNTHQEAVDAFTEWRERFREQGSYSSATNGDIYDELHKHCKLVMIAENYTPALIQVTEFDPFPGYIDPFREYWNGWLKPYITHDQVARFIEVHSTEEDMFQHIGKSIVYINKELESAEVIHAISRTINGEAVLLYDLADLGWCFVQEEEKV